MFISPFTVRQQKWSGQQAENCRWAAGGRYFFVWDTAWQRVLNVEPKRVGYGIVCVRRSRDVVGVDVPDVKKELNGINSRCARPGGQIWLGSGSTGLVGQRLGLLRKECE
jgi:hypothetical protein